MQQLIAQRHGAGGGEVADVGGHALADAWDREQRLGIARPARQAGGLLFHGFSSAPVGANTERIGGIDFEQRRGFIEQAGERNVVHHPPCSDWLAQPWYAAATLQNRQDAGRTPNRA